MDWNNFFAVVPVEVQAILQGKKKPLKKLKYYLSIVTDSFSFFPAVWLSGFNFDLQNHISNFKN